MARLRGTVDTQLTIPFHTLQLDTRSLFTVILFEGVASVCVPA